MKCKTFECPYLTEEDKKFLEYEQKIYEESAKEIIALYRRCEDKHKSDCDGQDDYLQYSLLRFALKMNISNVCSNIPVSYTHLIQALVKYISCRIMNWRLRKEK